MDHSDIWECNVKDKFYLQFKTLSSTEVLLTLQAREKGAQYMGGYHEYTVVLP